MVRGEGEKKSTESLPCRLLKGLIGRKHGISNLKKHCRKEEGKKLSGRRDSLSPRRLLIIVLGRAKKGLVEDATVNPKIVASGNGLHLEKTGLDENGESSEE